MIDAIKLQTYIFINKVYLPERNKRRIEAALNWFERFLGRHVQINDGIASNKVSGVRPFMGIQRSVVHNLLLGQRE